MSVISVWIFSNNDKYMYTAYVQFQHVWDPSLLERRCHGLPQHFPTSQTANWVINVTSTTGTFATILLSWDLWSKNNNLQQRHRGQLDRLFFHLGRCPVGSNWWATYEHDWYEADYDMDGSPVHTWLAPHSATLLVGDGRVCGVMDVLLGTILIR